MITVNELFSGIGAQVSALKRLGIQYKVEGISEIDKFAIQSYESMNGKTRNYGDISKIEKLDYADLWTYSFPCQDISVAGKGEGISSKTRSGLLLEVERLLETAVGEGNQPKYLLLENVKNLVGKKFKTEFERWLKKLSDLGYNNYWQVLNSKDYGVPQNRERVFVVSIRKDIDKKGYKFPEKIPLMKNLKDVLEQEVDEKYYLPKEKVKKLNLKLEKEISNRVRCGGGGSLDGKHTWDLVIAASRGRNPENPSSKESGLPTEKRLEVNSKGISNTITTVQKDNYVIKPVGNIRETTKNTMKCGQSQPYVLQEPINTCSDGVSQSLTAHLHKETANDCVKFERHSPSTGIMEKSYSNEIRIRKLTPKECFRLMGFTDEEFDLAKNSGVSNSQLYKQAGNSIVVDVLVAIFKNLFGGENVQHF